MGYSCTAAASRTMDAIEAACAESRKPHGDTSGNVFFVGADRFFYEIVRRDQAGRVAAGEETAG
jgi:hypothetical protein